MIDENQVVDIVCRHLEGAGFQIEQRLATTQQGIDIVARHPDGWRYLIEAKGETSSRRGSQRFGKPYSASQIFDRAAKAVYTALSLRHMCGRESDDRVVIAIPDNDHFRRYMDAVEDSLRELHVDTFWINGEESVTLASR